MQTAMPRVVAGQSGTSEHELRKRFSAVSGWRGGLDLLGHWLAIVAVAWAATTVGHWAGYVLAAIIIAGLQHGLINLTHEAWHRLCFRNKRVNDVVGAWFYCYPVGMPYYHDRRRHWDHHRLIGRHDDPDWLNYSNDGRVPASRLLLFLGGRLLGSQLVVSVYNLLINRRARIEVQPASRDQRLPSPAAELVRVVACQVGLIGFFALIGPWWAYLVLWVWPLTGPASVFIAIRAFAEHASEDDDAPVDERLYDFSPNPLEAFFLSPCHSGYAVCDVASEL